MNKFKPKGYVKDLLLRGDRITTAQLLAEKQNWRLPAYIHAIRKEYKWPICMRMVTEANTKKRTAEYWLTENAIKNILDEATANHANESQSLTDNGGIKK